MHLADTARQVTLNTCPLNHPDGACGHRVDHEGKSVCVITDTEHPSDGLDQTIVDFVRDADIMIYDATYTEAEYPAHKDWGHSTWQEAGGRRRRRRHRGPVPSRSVP